MDSVKKLELVVRHVLCHINFHEINELMTYSVSDPTEVSHTFTEDRCEKVLTSVEELLNMYKQNYEEKFNNFMELIFNEIIALIKMKFVDNNKISDTNFNHALNVFSLALEVNVTHAPSLNKGMVSFYKHIVSEIMTVIKTSAEFVLVMNIISKIYETLHSLIKVKPELNDTVKELVSDLGIEETCELLSAHLTNEFEGVAVVVLLLVPKYKELCGSNYILQKIWDKITDLSMRFHVEYKRSYSTLCFLEKFYFVPENRVLILKIMKDKNFWALLQSGLVNEDAPLRKQALYLLKKTCSFLLQKNFCTHCFFEGYEEGGFNGCVILETHGIKFNEFVEYEKFCNIFDYLEEKQIHIVEPVFNMIQTFINKNVEDKILPTSWLIMIIKRMLQHDNLRVYKMGISFLLKIPISVYSDEDEISSVVSLLTSGLNNTQIYMADLSTFLQELKDFFIAMTESNNKELFFKLLLKEMVSVKWSSEALFFATHFFQNMTIKDFWKESEMTLVNNLITHKAANHYKYIKSGIECQVLQAGINLLDTSPGALDDTFEFINSFSRELSLNRKSQIWRNIVQWIKKTYDANTAINFLIKIISLQTKGAGRLMLLFYDSHYETSEFSVYFDRMVNVMSTSFQTVFARPYLDYHIYDYYFAAVSYIVEEARDSEVIEMIDARIRDMIKYLEVRLMSMYDLKEYSLSHQLLKTLGTLLKLYKVTDNINGWVSNIQSKMPVTGITNPLQKYISVKVLNVIGEYVENDVTVTFKEHLKINLNKGLSVKKNSLLSEEEMVTWGKMSSDYLKANWELLSKTSVPSSEILDITPSHLPDLCFQAIDVGGHFVLQPLMIVLKKELSSQLCEDKTKALLETVWDTILTRKKNEDFYDLLKTFVEMIFQPDIIKTDDDTIQSILLKYMNIFFEKLTKHATYIFLKHMETIQYCREFEYFFLPTLTQALLFGQPQRKDERLIMEIYTIIETEGLTPLKNIRITSNEIRVSAVRILLNLSPTCEEHKEFVGNLIGALIEAEQKISKNKTRYFCDSNIHRTKLRLMQSLLILEPFTSEDMLENLWKWTLNQLLTENNQPSVRYLQEWLMLRILNRIERLRNVLWECFNEGLEKRTGSLCSFMTIAYHFVKLLPIQDVKQYIDRTIQTFLPYCMAQHFSVRLYAQFTLQKLLSLAESLEFGDLVEIYSVVRNSLRQSIEKGNAVKNCAKMEEDFYFTAFHPLEHFSLETIFFDLPRLTNVGSDEWIEVESFEGYSGGLIPLKSGNESLKSFCGKWLNELSSEVLIESPSTESTEQQNFQKKMIPMKCMTPNFDDQMKEYKKPEKEGLVVVASLIDRIPNLGGLTRTCEVFGAFELVIGSLQYIEDKQFQSLSVTSEKWISLTEVKPVNLADYLLMMKKNGYTLFAAEQTINSQRLESVKFPKKCIVLLGNEKEGIPPDLLPLMDVCVEVPQMGVVRSLNVHVTGALFVWEYAKQHHLTSTS